MTLRSARQLRYPRNKLAFLIADNSDEDHPDYLALCREVEARRCGGEAIELLHRRGTQGFKAADLDMALQVASGDLLLFLDVDNTVPEDLLLIHADSLCRDPGVAFRQCRHIACNGSESLAAATAGSVLGYGMYHDLALAKYADWSFFSGACFHLEALGSSPGCPCQSVSERQKYSDRGLVCVISGLPVWIAWQDRRDAFGLLGSF